MSFDLISTVAPWLVTGLTSGPVGLAAKAAVTLAGALGLDSSSNVSSALTSLIPTPEQRNALAQAENTFKLQMLQAGYTDIEALKKMDLDQVAAVNATIVAELQNSKQETWLQKSWRPLCGMSVAVGSFSCVILAMVAYTAAIFFHDVEIVSKLPDAVTSISLILAVPGAAVGIMAWHKGAQEVAQASSGSTASSVSN
jgi:hypothetical protein